MNTVTKLSRDLAPALNQAEEIWIAVAMLTMQGLDFLLDNTRPNCKINLLVGVDLPTDPKALEKLIQLQAEKEFRVQLFIENKEFFHPKLYLIKDLYSYIGFIGSANFTNGGLNENIELTIQVDNDHLCNELKSWFFELFNRAKPLTSSFAKEYRANYSKRKELKSKEERIVRVNKKKFNQEFEAKLRERNLFLNALQKFRTGRAYSEIKKQRTDTVNDLRKVLDYPNFENINIDGFFSNWDLGHIISLPKPTIKREKDKFSRTLKMLCDDTIDIAERYDKALMNRENKIRGVDEGLVSKVLAIHNPQEYFVRNSKSVKALKSKALNCRVGLQREKDINELINS